MLNYKIATLAKQKRGQARAFLPAIEPSLSAEMSYLRELRKALREVALWTSETLIPAYEAEMRVRGQARVTTDANEETFSALNILTRALSRIVSGAVNNILRLEAKRHTKTFMATAKRALGIDLSAVVQENDLGQYLELAGMRNASLIGGLLDDTAKRIRDRTIAAVLAGDTSKSLKRTLVNEFGLSDSRAKLIARDQLGKTTSDLNRLRHQQAGIERYVWTTSRDERVRPRHRKLDGVEYAYGETTGAEQGLPPGQPIQCRCIARAIVSFGEGVNRVVFNATPTSPLNTPPAPANPVVAPVAATRTGRIPYRQQSPELKQGDDVAAFEATYDLLKARGIERA